MTDGIKGHSVSQWYTDGIMHSVVEYTDTESSIMVGKKGDEEWVDLSKTETMIQSMQQNPLWEGGTLTIDEMPPYREYRDEEGNHILTVGRPVPEFPGVFIPNNRHGRRMRWKMGK